MAISGSQIVAEVRKFLGDPYVYGAAGPTTFDCSGLVQFVLTKLGVKGVPRTSEEQWSWVQKIQQNQLRPGDLIFSQWPGDNASPGHVGVYAGGGKIIAADNPSAGVTTDTLASWSGHIVGYGRVPGTAAAAAAAAATPDQSGLGGLLSWPGEIIGFFSDLDHWAGELWQGLVALFSPSTWVRAAAGIGGAVLLGFGLWFLIRAAA